MVRLASLRPEAWTPGTSGWDHGELRARASLPQLPGRVVPGVLWLTVSTSPPPARDAAPPPHIVSARLSSCCRVCPRRGGRVAPVSAIANSVRMKRGNRCFRAAVGSELAWT